MKVSLLVLVVAAFATASTACGDGVTDEDRWRACIAEEERARRHPDITPGQICCMRADVPHETHCL